MCIKFYTFLYIICEKGKRLMSEVIAIEGGYKLNGSVRISGAKNATVALIPAAVLSDGPVEILGVPEISDVEALAILLKELKCEVEVDGERIRIDPTHMEDIPLISDAVNKLRASYYFMGTLLGKYKRVKIKMPGGCYLGPRPIDLHFKGFEALGAKISCVEDTYLLEADELIGTSIYLDFASVGATINIMLAAVRAKGKTVIENAAKEPEIIDVANLLTKMGAKIRGVGTDTITIEGVDYLGGTFHEIIPDRIEAGTFLIIAAAAGEKVIVQNVIPQHLEALISKLKEMGIKMEVVGDNIVVYGHDELKSVDIKTQIYPGFATDLQQPLTTLLTQAQGESHVKETIYVERFKHCGELNKMGAHIEVGEAQSTIHGQTPLHGARVEATDLRCGAALVIAGLIAEGKTEITNVYHIDRGYDNIDHKLITLGAHITRYEIED